MKISKTLLKTIAAGVILSGAMTSCVTDKELIKPETTCEADCDIDHKHNKDKNNHIDNCPACGLG
ncbi:MAG: hypothetical protein AB8F95_13485 [Bacteroidia bacterium]